MNIVCISESNQRHYIVFYTNNLLQMVVTSVVTVLNLKKKHTFSCFPLSKFPGKCLSVSSLQKT